MKKFPEQDLDNEAASALQLMLRPLTSRSLQSVLAQQEQLEPVLEGGGGEKRMEDGVWESSELRCLLSLESHPAPASSLEGLHTALLAVLALHCLLYTGWLDRKVFQGEHCSLLPGRKLAAVKTRPRPPSCCGCW